ncbi:uncharacterized protein LOC142817523 [Rhipicephalus microplus]|uniref:uncharacterized protein LOC142817523 n=1 Tax=Rhipicephalus microplus TaxID=6941 RepID=UPI003F6B4A3A
MTTTPTEEQCKAMKCCMKLEGILSGYDTPHFHEEPRRYERHGRHQECCEQSLHPPPHMYYPAGPPASQATLVSTPIPISVPMPMPSGGGCRGQSGPIVINPPASQPAPPQPLPPPPPEPRPSPTQEMASAMMLTIVDYMRRRLDKQLRRMSEDDKLKSSALPPITSQPMSELGSSLPLTPLAPMPSADSPASTGGQALPHPPGKKHKKKTHKSLGVESSSEESALGKNSRQAKQQLAPAMHAISKQGADIVEKLQSSISPEDKSE